MLQSFRLVSFPLLASCLWGTGLSFTPLQSPSKQGSSRLFQQQPSEHSTDDQWALPVFSDNDDWRSFRAKLVLQEHGFKTANEEQTQEWAYQQPNLEKGALLVQDPFSMEAEPQKEQYMSKLLKHIHWYKSVMVVLESDEQETVALTLNRPANLTLTPIDGYSSTLLYGGSTSSFHAPDHRVFCLHRSDALKDESTIIMKGLYVMSLEEAQICMKENRAVAADFLYISGYERFKTSELNDHLKKGHWRSITTDSYTLQKSLVPDVWTAMLTITGSPPPETMKQLYSTDDVPVLDALLQEWTHTCLYYHSPASQDQRHPPPPPPMDRPIRQGDLLRGSSLDHAFLFDHQEFHKSLVMVLEVRSGGDSAVAALLSYPTVEMESTTGLPIRHGGNDGEDEMYCLHFLGQSDVRSSTPIGNNFYRCSVSDMLDALKTGKAQREDFLVMKGYVEFPLQGAALDIVLPDATPSIWQTLGHQQALNPFVLEENIQIARHAWKCAGGEEMVRSPVNDLGKETVKAWLASNLMPPMPPNRQRDELGPWNTDLRP